jgi:hypothetical protein
VTNLRLISVCRGFVVAAFSVVIALGGSGCSDDKTTTNPKPSAEVKEMSPEEVKAKLEGSNGSAPAKSKTPAKK